MEKVVIPGVKTVNAECVQLNGFSCRGTAIINGKTVNIIRLYDGEHYILLCPDLATEVQKLAYIEERYQKSLQMKVRELSQWHETLGNKTGGMTKGNMRAFLRILYRKHFKML